MKYLTRRLMLLVLMVVVSVQMTVVFPVSANESTRNPYETFIATSLDSQGSGVTILEDRVGSISSSSWVCFKNVDFGKVGPYGVEIETTSPASNSTSTVLLKLDDSKGTTFAEIPITPSSDWGVGVINYVDIKTKVTGVHDLYVTCKNKTLAFRSMIFYTSEGEENIFRYEKYSQTSNFSDTKSEELAIKTLVNLGIISISDDGVYDLKRVVSRGEFANSIFRLFVEDNGEDAKQTVTRFTDVKVDHKYAEAIEYVSQRGFMNGVSETEFSPSSYITYADALTVISRALGYREIAECKGGYPTGYIEVATSNKIRLTDVGFNEYITRSDMVSLIEKTLFANYLTMDSIVNGGAVFDEIKGILGETRHIYYGDGVVNATALSMLNMPDSELRTDEVEIDGITYKTGKLNVYGLLGFDCDFWYYENDGERTLCSIVPSLSVECIEIPAEDITLISNNKIKYFPKGKTKEKTINISSYTSVIYNGVAIDKEITSVVDYENSFTGTISYAENGDGSTVVLIDEYNDYVVESLDYFTSTLNVVGFNDRITLDSEENFVSIVDTNGRTVKVSKLKIGDIVTVYQSKNSSGPKVVRVYLSDKNIKGTISQVNFNDDSVIIGKKEYKKSNHYQGDLVVGQQGIFYLNIYDQIVKFAVNEENSVLIGLFVAYDYLEKGFNKSIRIKLIDDKGKPQIYNVAQKVTYNGKKIKNVEEIISNVSYGSKACYGLDNLPTEEIFRYTLNSDGEISMIDTYEELLGDMNDTLIKHNDIKQTMKYSQGADIISLGDYLKFYMNGKSLAYSYYNDIEDKEDFWVVGSAESMFPASNISVNGLTYSTEGSMYAADVVLFERTMEYGVDWEAPIIVESVSYGLDETGCDAVIIRGYGNKGNKVEYIASYETVPFENKMTLLENVKEGDVIRLKIKQDKIADADVVFFFDGAESREVVGGETIKAVINKKTIPATGYGFDWRYIYGTVGHVDNDYIVIETLATDAEGNEVRNTEVLAKPQNTTLYSKANGSRTTIISGAPTSAISLNDMVLALFVDGKVSQVIVYDMD